MAQPIPASRRSLGGASALGLVAALLAAAIDVLYIQLLQSQQPVGSALPRVVFLNGFLTVGALAFAVGAIAPQRRLRVALLGLGTLVCWALGILAIFSIGLPLLVVAVVGTVALIRQMRVAPGTGPAAVVLLTWLGTLFVLALGLALTQPISGAITVDCPPQGHLQGSATSNGATTHYRCDDGRLTTAP